MLGAGGTQPTARAREIHAFMLAFRNEHSMWPTVREICAEFGFASTNSAHTFLRTLKRHGWVRQRVNCARGWIAIERPEAA